jgi:hypothetical protein
VRAVRHSNQCSGTVPLHPPLCCSQWDWALLERAQHCLPARHHLRPVPKSLVTPAALPRGRWNKDGNGSPNYEMDERTFLLNRERAVDYLNMLDRLYVFDGYAGWDPEVRLA